MHLLAISENILLQSVLLAALIFFHSKSDRTVNKFLALYIFCIAIIMSGPIILQFGSWQHNFFTEPFTVSVGAMMYLYVRSMKERVTWRKALPHLLPFILYFIGSCVWVVYLNNKYPTAKAMPAEAIQSSPMIGWFLLRYVILYAYYFLARRALRDYQHSIRHIFSETSRLDLNWIRLLLNGYVLLVTISVAALVAMLSFPQYIYLFYLANIAIATPYVYLSTYKSLTQPTIWQRSKKMGGAGMEEQMITASIAREKEKHNHSKQTRAATVDPLVAETAARIIRMMEEDKLYQETELTLQQLSDKLALSSHRVFLAKAVAFTC